MATPIPKNRARFSLEEIVTITGGRLQTASDAATASVVGICTDTRNVTPGNAFVALRGERFDGHDHVDSAVRAGATVLVVEREVSSQAHVIVVGDALRALGDLARAHRKAWAMANGYDARIVAVTGSAGKTTTRSAIVALLNAVGKRVHSTVGNLNNAVGVPMVLLGLESRHDTLVAEIGTNAHGEIAYLTAMVQPDIAVLTLVAEAHSEGLGGLDAIAREKGCIFAGLRADGVAIVNGDDDWATAQLRRTDATTSTRVGEKPNADVQVVSSRSLGVRGTRVHVRTRRMMPLPGTGADSDAEVSELTFDTPILGVAGRCSSGFAIAVGGAMGIDLTDEDLTRGFSSLDEGRAGRLCPVTLRNGTIVLDDAYNANSASMRASLNSAAELARELGRRLVLVLGEMFELGACADKAHADVGKAIVEAAPDAVVSVGAQARAFHLAAQSDGIKSVWVQTAAEASASSLQLVSPGDVVLVKGSNGVRLHLVIEALTASGVRPEPA